MRAVSAFFAIILFVVFVTFQNCGSNPRFDTVTSSKAGPEALATICPEPSPWPFTWKHISVVQTSGLGAENSYSNYFHLGLAQYTTGGVLNLSFKQNPGTPSETSCMLNLELTWLDLETFYNLSHALDVCEMTVEESTCVLGATTEAWYLAQTMTDPSNPTIGYDKMGYYMSGPCLNSPLVCHGATQLRSLVRQKIDSSITPEQRASCPAGFLNYLN